MTTITTHALETEPFRTVHLNKSDDKIVAKMATCNENMTTPDSNMKPATSLTSFTVNRILHQQTTDAASTSANQCSLSNPEEASSQSHNPALIMHSALNGRMASGLSATNNIAFANTTLPTATARPCTDDNIIQQYLLLQQLLAAHGRGAFLTSSAQQFGSNNNINVSENGGTNSTTSNETHPTDTVISKQSSNGNNNNSVTTAPAASFSLSTFLRAAASANINTSAGQRLFLPPTSLQPPPQPVLPWPMFPTNYTQHAFSTSSSVPHLPRPVPSYALPANILANLQQQQQQNTATTTYNNNHHHEQQQISPSLSSHMNAAAALFGGGGINQQQHKFHFPFAHPNTAGHFPTSAFERPFAAAVINDVKVRHHRFDATCSEEGSGDEEKDGVEEDDDCLSDDQPSENEDDLHCNDRQRNARRQPTFLHHKHSIEMVTTGGGGNYHRHSRHSLNNSNNNNNNISSSSSCGKKKKTRTVFSRSQVFQLESAFEMKRYLSSSDRAGIAASLNLTEQQIKIWFQNRRNKWKRQYSTDFTDPTRRLSSTMGQPPPPCSVTLGGAPTSGNILSAHSPNALNNNNNNMPPHPSPHHHHHQHHHARYAALSQLAVNSAMLTQHHGLMSNSNTSTIINEAGSNIAAHHQLHYPFSAGISQPLPKYSNNTNLVPVSSSNSNNNLLGPPSASLFSTPTSSNVIDSRTSATGGQQHLSSSHAFYAAAVAAAAAAEGDTSTANSLLNSAVHASALQSLFAHHHHHSTSNNFWPGTFLLPTSAFPPASNTTMQSSSSVLAPTGEVTSSSATTESPTKMLLIREIKKQISSSP